MTYVRVIPRDLFNEANLLKCYGQLWLVLEKLNGRAELVHDTDEASEFRVEQDASDGSLSIENVVLYVSDIPVRLFRPLNARTSWPLLFVHRDDALPVFNLVGELSTQFLLWAVHPLDLAAVDPFLGDTVCGPDNATGRVVGTSRRPHVRGGFVQHVLVEHSDGTMSEWREIDVLVVALNPEVPIERRVGRSETHMEEA